MPDQTAADPEAYPLRSIECVDVPIHKPLKPPHEAVVTLERAARCDHNLAKLTLGLIGAVLGDPLCETFPDYRWQLNHISEFPPHLQHAASMLLEWGQNRNIVVDRLLHARNEITAAVTATHRASPYGRRRREIADSLRNQYPQIKPHSLDQQRLYALEILSDEMHRPLGLETIRRIQAFEPSQIEIRAHDEAFYCPWACRGVNVVLQPDGYTVRKITITVPLRLRKETVEVHGYLFDFFETGTEGVVWSVLDDDARDYGAVRPIEQGDHLTICDELGNELWRGVIHCDYASGWRPFKANPEYGQPQALGYQVHWTQRGFTPDTWARFFIRPTHERFRAVLRKGRSDIPP